MIVIFEPDAVDARLSLMNLDREVFVDALVQANMYRARLTSHHPKLYRHATLTCECVAALRDFLIPRGWIKEDEGNYELVLNPDLNLGIAVASGNDLTGSIDRIPSNKSEKGPRTVKAVDDNQTADLFPETLSKMECPENSMDTWILLHHLAGDIIRLELSRPCGYDISEKFITTWSERIILGSIPLTGTPSVEPIPQLPDIDFEITRKTG